MGMFDRIDFKMNCPRCEKDMGEFQSKDGSCCMFTLDWWEVDNFYSSCDHCKTWVEFTLEGKRPNRKLALKDYKKKVEKTTKKDDEKRKEDLSRLFLKSYRRQKRGEE